MPVPHLGEQHRRRVRRLLGPGHLGLHFIQLWFLNATMPVDLDFPYAGGNQCLTWQSSTLPCALPVPAGTPPGGRSRACTDSPRRSRAGPPPRHGLSCRHGHSAKRPDRGIRASRTVAVVGAGAAGLTAALRAAEAGGARDAAQRPPEGRAQDPHVAAARAATSPTARSTRARLPRRLAQRRARASCARSPPEADARVVRVARRAAQARGDRQVLPGERRRADRARRAARRVRARRGARSRAGRASCGSSAPRAPRLAARHPGACADERRVRAGRARRRRDGVAAARGRARPTGSRPTPSCSPPAGSRSRAPAATAPATPWPPRSATPSCRPCPRSRRSPRDDPLVRATCRASRWRPS